MFANRSKRPTPNAQSKMERRRRFIFGMATGAVALQCDLGVEATTEVGRLAMVSLSFRLASALSLVAP
ncbi:MAG: hypothetical protein JWP08_135 [Bryobacterales bacterium]|nr:hypothetical protein [Bryobacterales bacterium]